jgi:hypothetical protein
MPVSRGWRVSSAERRVIVDPVPNPNRVLELELDTNTGADEGLPKSGSLLPSAYSSIAAGLSSRPSPSAGGSGWGIAVVCIGRSLNTKGI